MRRPARSKSTPRGANGVDMGSPHAILTRMQAVRRNGVQAIVVGLLAIGLITSAAIAQTGLRNAATTCTGYALQPGYGYGYGYDAQFGYGCPSTPAARPDNKVE